MNSRFPLAPRRLPLGPQQQVYVVTTTAAPPASTKQLFGVHRQRSPDECFATYVFGFKEQRHAEIVARSLDNYHKKHGTFPSRDIDAIAHQVDLVAPPPPAAAEDDDQAPQQGGSVSVDAVALSDLLLRVRGTGITITLLSRDEARPDRLTFTCKDVRADTTLSAVVSRLNTAWSTSPAAEKPRYYTLSEDKTTPRLLPKPVWPPSGSSRPGPLGMLVHLMAASLFKLLVTAEVLALFWLLPTLLL